MKKKVAAYWLAGGIVLTIIIGSLLIFITGKESKRIYKQSLALLKTKPVHIEVPEIPQTELPDSLPTHIDSMATGSSKFAIKGTVEDEAGNPITNALISVYKPRDSKQNFPPIKVQEKGHFKTAKLPLDLYQLEASAEGYGEDIAYDVIPGGPLVRFVLKAGSVIEGRVYDQKIPASKRAVLLSGIGMWPPRTTQTDETGTRNGTFQV